MNSREIYNRARKTIEWEDKWIHIGTGNENEIDIELLTNHISDQFSDERNIMLKRGRKKLAIH